MNIQEHKFYTYNQQSGLALVLALIFLLVSTLLAVASMRSSVSEEQMSRNTMHREQAFQIAEVTLTIGEAYVETNADTIIADVFLNPMGTDGSQTYDGDSCKYGFCIPVKRSEVLSETVATDEHWKNDSTWSNSGKHRTISDADKDELGAVEDAKYIIEFMRFTNVDNDADTCDFNDNGAYDAGEGTADWTTWPFCTLDKKEFRVTALGYAGNIGQSRVMLQSIYITL